MRVVITGGTGLIGRALVDRLVTEGHEVIVLSRSPESVKGFPSGVRLVKWDGRTAEGWGDLADGADAIVNLAGENIAGKNPLLGRWTPERKRRILESRVQAGQAVTQAVEAASRKPRVVLQSSGVNYYGVRGDEEITEEASPGNDFLAKVCLDWEASTAPIEAMGVRRVVMRTSVVFSADGGVLPIMLLPFRLVIAGGPLGSGKQWISWIHIADMVGAICFLMENREASGVYNLSAPNPLRNADFARAVGRVMGRPSFMPAPALALRLALGEMSTLVLDGQRVIPAHLLKLGYTFRYPEVEGALRDLLRR